MTTTEILQHAHCILLVDWPSRDVPETLVRAGFTVYVKGGPNPDDFFLYEWRDNQLAQKRVGHAPAHADLVYSYRPLSELPGIIALAQGAGAKTIWTQSGLCADGKMQDPRGCWLSDSDRLAAGRQIQAAGLHHITQPYLADAARQLTRAHS